MFSFSGNLIPIKCLASTKISLGNLAVRLKAADAKLIIVILP